MNYPYIHKFKNIAMTSISIISRIRCHYKIENFLVNIRTKILNMLTNNLSFGHKNPNLLTHQLFQFTTIIIASKLVTKRIENNF